MSLAEHTLTLTILAPRDWTRAQRHAAWKQFDAFARHFEPTLRNAASELLEDMKQRIVDITEDTLREETLLRADRKQVDADSVRAWQRRMRVERKRYHKRWLDRFRTLTEQQSEIVGGIVSGEIGASFNLFGPELQVFIARRPNLLAGNVTRSTFRGLMATIEQGMRAGESTRQLTQRVRDTFDRGLSIRDRRGRVRFLGKDARARLIARTEATAITNGAALRAVLDSGLETDKEWLTQGDDRVRDDHIAMEGEVVPSEEKFSNGLDEPSEPMCRCTLVFHTRQVRRLSA